MKTNFTEAFSQWLPKDEPSKVEASSQGRVTARLEINDFAVCQYCKKPMRVSKCGDLPVFVCDNDRAVNPMSNEQMEQLKNGTYEPQTVPNDPAAPSAEPMGLNFQQILDQFTRSLR